MKISASVASVIHLPKTSDSLEAIYPKSLYTSFSNNALLGIFVSSVKLINSQVGYW